jgi:predicted permease
MPALLRHLLVRLRALVRRDVVASEIREELLTHVDMRAEDLERQGVPRDEARRRAVRRFGSVALHQDRGYDVRGGGVTETVLQDLRYALRLLSAQRGFSLIAILTLAIGVGLSTALFSVIHAAVVRPLPFANPGQLVNVNVPSDGGDQTSPSLEDVRAWRADGRVFQQASLDRGTYDRLVDAGQPEWVQVRSVTEGFFETLGVLPLAGRTFAEPDVVREAPLVALVGHSYWRSRFGGDGAAIGRQIRVAGEPATVIGILPAGLFPDIEVWQPFKPGIQERMRGSGAPAVARLRPGLSRQEGEKALAQFVAAFDAAQGKTYSSPVGSAVRLFSIYDRAVEGKGPVLWTLSGAVLAILLIACVNVAGLLLARGATRQRELAIRASIGAGRARLTRQLLTESLVLACTGGVAGVLLAWISLDLLVAIVPLSLPENGTASLNGEVLLFAAAVTISTALVFGLVPALRLSRVTVLAALAGADRRSGAPLPRRTGQWLIAAEVALGVVLVAGAVLMIRSFSRVISVDLGYDPGSFLTMEVAPLDPDPGVLSRYYPALVDALRRLPEVEAAGAGNQLPMGGSRRAGWLKVGGQEVRVDQRLVLPGFFEAIGLPLKAGRFLTEGDLTSGHPVVVINEMTARQAFGNQPPVGRLLPLARESPPEVVGVVGDFLQDGAQGPVRANVYAPYTGRERLGSSNRVQFLVFVRPRGNPAGFATRLRDVAHAIGPRVLVDRIRSGDDYVSESVTVPRHRMVLLGLLGGVGLLLTVVGIFSITAFAVARRTREIGVRMAFGAGKRQVIRAIVRDVLKPAALGLVAGATGAYLTTGVLRTLLFETTPHDPVAFVAALVTLGLAAVLAAWLPARRAALVDPVHALRTE